RGQVAEQAAQRAELAGDQLADVPHDQPEPGVAEVLHGGPEVHVLGGGRRHDALQLVDQPEGRVARGPGVRRDPVQVEPAGLGVLGDQPGRPGRNDPQLRLGPCQCRQDVQPALQPLPLLEEPVQLRGGPQVPVGDRVGDPGAHHGGGSEGITAVSARSPRRSASTLTTSSRATLPRLTSGPNRLMHQACWSRRGASKRMRSWPATPTTASTTSSITAPLASYVPTVPLSRPSVTTSQAPAARSSPTSLFHSPRSSCRPGSLTPT